MIDANNAMRQAHITAAEYFEMLATVIDKRYPKASEGDRLAAAVELSKVAATDFLSCELSGSVSNTPIREALLSVSRIAAELSSISDAISEVGEAINAPSD